MNHSKFIGFMLCSLAGLSVAGQAFAHTGVREQATEGTASYNGFTITHGCGGDSGEGYPVIGQAAVFPYNDNAVWRDAAKKVIARGGNGGGIIEADFLSLNPTGYAAFPSAFATTQEIVDDLGNVQALLWKNGAMEPKLNTITPFKISPPVIVDNCKRLNIRVAVINYCDTGKNAANDKNGPWKAPRDAFGNPIPHTTTVDDGGIQKNVADSPMFRDMRQGNGDNNRADWWFSNLDGGSALYNDPDLTAEGDGLWSAVIKVNNSPAQLATCPKDANGNPVVTDVYVEPNGAALDAVLTGKNTQPFTAGPGPY